MRRSSSNPLRDESQWKTLHQARKEFGTKFADEEVADSFFLHALSKGFLRSRYNVFTELRALETSDDLRIAEHKPPMIPKRWWASVLLDHKDTSLLAGRACFGDKWGDARATAEAIEVYSPDVLRLVSRKQVGGRPFNKQAWETMTLRVAFLIRHGDFEIFENFTEFKKDLFDHINANGEALSDTALAGPALQLWNQYQALQDKNPPRA